ncbi:hypothetical protein M3B90_07840 [Dermabacter sp. p3-SID358]|uniref:hypothetical protein n=1 Tax=Dermabacter sp. p3-SID358 TaxID=2916114 RepID=UPI0021A369BE|nr:hypothetical protein [Dermabacter sp. p3-SID358]MCT1867436.1 hypothetical protein [Dermabacter sp. p3-SID358]
MNQKDRALKISNRKGENFARRALRSVTGWIGNDETPTRIVQAQKDEQLPITTGRRVAFLGAHGGAGVTSLLVATAGYLAQARGGSVTVSGLRSTSDLSWFLGSNHHERGLRLHETPLVRARESIGEISRAQQLLLIDCDSHVTDEELAMLMPHVIVIVGRRTVQGIEKVENIREALGDKYGATIRLLCETPNSGLGKPRGGIQLGELVVIPHDKHLAGDSHVNIRNISEPARVSIEELGALMMQLAVSR